MCSCAFLCACSCACARAHTGMDSSWEQFQHVFLWCMRSMRIKMVGNNFTREEEDILITVSYWTLHYSYKYMWHACNIQMYVYGDKTFLIFRNTYKILFHIVCLLQCLHRNDLWKQVLLAFKNNTYCPKSLISTNLMYIKMSFCLSVIYGRPNDWTNLH